VTGIVTVVSPIALRSVEVYTMTGQRLPVRSAAGSDANSWLIDLTGLSKGMYLLKSIDIKGEMVITKLIKL
jgi:hypothetical protein